jgi:hypothetical protein
VFTRRIAMDRSTAIRWHATRTDGGIEESKIRRSEDPKKTVPLSRPDTSLQGGLSFKITQEKERSGDGGGPDS